MSKQSNSPKKLKLSNLKAFSPVSSVSGNRKTIYVFSQIIAEVDIAVIVAYNPNNFLNEPYTYPAAKAINEFMGSGQTNALIDAGIIATAARVRDAGTDIPLFNKAKYPHKAYLARGNNFYEGNELKQVCNKFCEVSTKKSSLICFIDWLTVVSSL